MSYLLRKLQHWKTAWLTSRNSFLFSGVVNVRRRRWVSGPPELRQCEGGLPHSGLVSNVTFQCCHEAQHFYPTGNLPPLCSWKKTFNQFQWWVITYLHVPEAVSFRMINILQMVYNSLHNGKWHVGRLNNLAFRFWASLSACKNHLSLLFNIHLHDMIII